MLESSPASHQKKIIATYEIEFGKGKVIMLGLFAERLANSKSFLNFFDKIVLTRALGSKYQLETNQLRQRYLLEVRLLERIQNSCPARNNDTSYFIK